MNIKIKAIKRRTRCLIAAVLTVGTVITGTAAPVYAADAIGIAAQALGVFGAYKSALAGILDLGNSAQMQDRSRRQDMDENGKAGNPLDTKVVDDVMNQLIAKGDYVLKANSLPFQYKNQKRGL